MPNLLPSEIVGQIMEDAGLGTQAGGTVDWNIRIGNIPNTPDRVYAVFDSGGISGDPKWLLDRPSVQVRIRAKKGEYQRAGQRAQDVVDALLGFPAGIVGGTYVASITQIGGIGFLGYDVAERPEFSANFRLIIEPPASAYTHREPL
jgi:hypothetical protein